MPPPVDLCPELTLSLPCPSLPARVKRSQLYFKDVPELRDERAPFRIVLSSVKPQDYPVPYETLLKNDVQFSAMEKENK